ncbi:asparagine synthase (glutamine-hydrolyzing) [Natronocella acetinitrilica]|uniref:asparagine synthase (glutamine-hydrolyzing) n=1 Tax=Natronocella acetinitrilica TaxID=414046 RepID=A0AAE3KDR8_9GAMM|nr:asparagine synthase (glutamine-hydrolyzing) [Natronocella acetinitrilica]MCP1677149.1 asparagine synthase (glutamine-hydrolyzing) [Natronocella acetinitrilica]
MCGIAGFWLNGNASTVDPESVLVAMGSAIAHRGPDGAGECFDLELGVGFSHRRLSIQDLSEHGAQPMASASERFTIVFNGEIYNFLSLRAELTALGHGFRGHSDTEVMLAAFEAWGVEAALTRFAGMFAFAVVDREERVLWLARDRMGEKPLYYGMANGVLLFGSELKALRAYPGFAPAVNRDALTLLLRHNYIPAPHSIYEGVHKLLPAHTLRVPLTGSVGDLTPLPYWRADSAFAQGAWQDESEAVSALEALLSQVIGEQMIADVPLGAFLSGGIDSSTVVALMQQQATRPVRTFTIGFREAGYNEAEHAAAVARHLQTDHTELYVAPQDAREVIPQLPRMFDEPFADSSQIPTCLVSRMTRQHVTVALSGDGGDELFAGYTRYPQTVRAWQRLCEAPGARVQAERALLNLPGGLARGAVRLLNGEQRHLSAAAVAEKVRRERGLRAATSLRAFYQRRISYWAEPSLLVQGGREPAYALNTDLPEGIAALSPQQQLQWLDLHSYLPDDILTKVDRAAMAVSLETRVPMLDHRFVEFALGLPPAWNMQGATGKQLLRRVVERHVPRELLERPKQGFAIPIEHWLRSELRDWAESLLNAQRLRHEGYWNAEIVRAVWHDHVSGKADFSFQLWGVLMFQAWLDEAAGE